MYGRRRVLEKLVHQVQVRNFFSREIFEKVLRMHSKCRLLGRERNICRERILEIMKFAFSNVESSEKIVVSSFAENAYFIKLLMGTGFRFNKQTTSRGDPKQRITLWMTIEEFKILMQNNL